MASPVTKKINLSANRNLNVAWTEKYLFILLDSSSNPKPMCILCYEKVSEVKEYNIKRHYEAKHKTFDDIYPVGSVTRTIQI